MAMRTVQELFEHELQELKVFASEFDVTEEMEAR